MLIIVISYICIVLYGFEIKAWYSEWIELSFGVKTDPSSDFSSDNSMTLGK